MSLENGQKGDLIEFYNKIYITRLKAFFNELPSLTHSDLAQNKYGGKRRLVGEKYPSVTRQPNILQSPLKELVSSPFLLAKDAQANDPARSPTSKMMVMGRQTARDGEDQYRGVHINPKVPKQSQKIIDFDNMSSFESEVDSRSKNRSYAEQEDFDKETQTILNRKFELMKKNTRAVNKSDENEMPGYGGRPAKVLFSKEY